MFDNNVLNLYNANEIRELIKCLDKQINDYENYIDIFTDSRDCLVKFLRDNDL